MSELIRKWDENIFGDTVQYNELYEDKLITRINGRIVEEKELIYYLNHDICPMNLKLKDCFEIFNLASKLRNEDKSERTLKIRAFYRAYHHLKIKESELVLSEKKNFNINKLHITRFGVYQSQFYFYRKENKCHITSVQLPHDFYYYGPKIFESPLVLRLKIKENIYNALDITDENKNIIKTGFDIFDYNKIKKLNYLYEDGIKGKYLKTYDGIGKIIYGGWDNSRDGGEQSHSPEYFYNRIKYLYIDDIFKNNIEEIRKMLELTII